MPSFDIVSEVNKVELANAVDQTNKEATNRFDFKGSSAKIELKDLELTAYADNDFQLDQLKTILIAKLTKRNVDTRYLEESHPEKMSGDKLKELIKIKSGIDQETAKKIVKYSKETKLKLQASIQGESLRVTGAKRDDLQALMQLLDKDINDLPLQYTNFRD